ncbi:MAG: SDR family oxidoreductase [Chloroflexi bacterium]|nr:SDR family oxidoreductase [Chloroflexota bacterium]
MAENLQGKLVLITGGSSGIGLALARLVAQEGARVALVARRKEKLEEALASLPGEGHRIFPCDVADAEAVEQMAAQVQGEMGVPDWVVNSAGITRPGYFWELPVEVFHQLMEVNYYGTVHVCKAFVPSMMERGSGHVVNISSVAGFLGVFGYTAYSGSKFAVWGFTDTLRAELKPTGVQTHIVFPPDTDTPQLHYEMPLKPPETKILAETGGLLSAEEVAQETIKGVRKGRYVILPGFDPKWMWKVSHLLGSGTYWLMDILVARARRIARKRGAKQAS